MSTSTETTEAKQASILAALAKIAKGLWHLGLAIVLAIIAGVFVQLDLCAIGTSFYFCAIATLISVSIYKSGSSSKPARDSGHY